MHLCAEAKCLHGLGKLQAEGPVQAWGKGWLLHLVLIRTTRGHVHIAFAGTFACSTQSRATNTCNKRSALAPALQAQSVPPPAKQEEALPQATAVSEQLPLGHIAYDKDGQLAGTQIKVQGTLKRGLQGPTRNPARWLEQPAGQRWMVS